MPDFYAPGEYDLAGFIVGVVDQGKLIDGTRIRSGIVVLGIASGGFTPTAIRWHAALF